jgi:hypothetical protein
MISFVATDANSFGINSLSIFLAVMRRLVVSKGEAAELMVQLSSSLSENLMLDYGKVEDILKKLDEFGDGCSDVHSHK